MKAWWNDLSSREQLLLTVLGAVAALFVVLQFTVRPLADWRANAARQAEQARDGFEMVAAAAAQGAASGVQAPRAQTPLRQALTQSAAAARIDLVRIGAEVNNQIEVQPEDVPGDRLFRWLANLHSQYGVTVAFADISRAENGAVKAQVLVFERNE